VPPSIPGHYQTHAPLQSCCMTLNGQSVHTPAPPCAFSVIVGRVSTEDGDRILELLRALREQESTPPYEVIVADRLQDAVSERIRAEFPKVQLFACPAGTSLPELRTLALDRARGDYVVVTEDHCVPEKDWLAAMAEAFEAASPRTAAVGGVVENGVCETGLDWATFLCEYSGFMGPIANGPVTAGAVPGMNVAYRRSAINSAGREVLTRGFWETTLHPLLAQKGMEFYLSDRIALRHKKSFPFRLFAAQRFLYSRYYAGIKFPPQQRVKRAGMAVLSLALPPLLLYRMVRSVAVKRRHVPELIRALPYLTLFALIWAAGEAVGYMFGPGDALSRIE
jgi:glycosyltransferase involved in cell wall biosynthesis